jgi:hypothetical protein
MLDFGIVDVRQTGLFDALGRSWGLFHDVASWPMLTDMVQRQSAQLLTSQGDHAWEAQGGMRDTHGNLTFKTTGSRAVAALMNSIAAEHGGFLWTEQDGNTWAVRLVSAAGNDPSVFHGFGLSCSAGAVTAEVREQLHRKAKGLRLYERAESCLWAIHATVLAQRASLVLLPDVMLGQLFWGGDSGKWPDHWRGHVRQVLASLLSVRWATFRFAKESWRPRFGAQAVALSYVEDLRVSRPEFNK